MPRLYADLDLYDQIKLGLIKVNNFSRTEVQFWNKVNKDGPIHPVYGQCWVWTGCTTECGYGKFGVCGKVLKVHRWAYEEFVGPISQELGVLHRCDNPPCIRPNHLFLGTQIENIADCNEKGRQAKGEALPQSKLTEEDVREIRRRYRPRSRVNNLRILAEEFRVGHIAIWDIINRKSWKHVV